MFSCRFCLFCVVTVFCIYLCVGSYHTKKSAETDKQALLKLKDGLLLGRDVLSSWRGEDCCKWKGISCNNLTGHVTTLDLPFLSEYSPLQRGKIDSSICELQHLTFLDLSDNDLEGEIPKCIGSLGQLTDLKLARNDLVGSVPHTLTNLSNLQTLDLGFNYLFVANDLEWLSHLSNLRYLHLSRMNLSRAIDWPSSISKIPFVSELYLEFCGLPQVNRKSIAHVNSSTSLRILCLSGNQLNSSFLSWVINVSTVLTHLDLSSNSLHSIPDCLANMISLQHLDLSYNELDGSIIKSFQTLFRLKELLLTFNKLFGQLSDYLSELYFAQDHLEQLALDQNPFSSGPLPDFSRFSSLKILSLGNTNIVGPLSFDHLPHLEVLRLGSNHLSGLLPVFEVTKFSALRDLDLSNNQLSGTLPCTIGQLSNLESLDLSLNKLNGIISETHLLSLSRLESLYVHQNSFSFNLTPNWLPPFQLMYLSASSCILGPQFPKWLQYQRNLMVLQISNAGIRDSFPKWFWNIPTSLLYVNVSHNKLSGVLPKSLANISYLSAWDFSSNNLSGPLPPFPPNIYALFLSNNMFSGFVSSFCATLPMYLTILDLSSNLLAGPLPDCWEKFQSLEVLNLANNSLSGGIPKSFGTLQQIESMHLNNNNFSGEIPPLTRCESLIVIDFGDNILEGTLSSWVGLNLLQLIVLRLRANKIRGNIPASLCNLSFLQVLDLSSNNITGEIPQCLNRLVALSDIKFPRESILYFRSGYSDDSSSTILVDETVLSWKGQNREYGKNLGLMTMIDLSDNHLTGEIPHSLTTLMALAGLNLSRNNLTGFIPNNVSHMQMLESLDLSRNHLYGKMPASFSNLSFLSYMNLSFNNLSGEIPVGTQLQSFDASTYAGNIGLCGPPLTNQCPGDAVTPNRRPDKNYINEYEDEIINFGFYISFGLGFCVGFWVVCGTLIVKGSWRHAYFKFLSNIKDRIYVTIVIFTARVKT